MHFLSNAENLDFLKIFHILDFDNFCDLPVFNQYKDKFHEIINTKKSFTKTKRPEFGGDDNPASNQYQNNPYRYPDNEKEFKKMFKDRDKYNKHIFINKKSILYPPIKNNEKDLILENTKKKIVFNGQKRDDSIMGFIKKRRR